MEVDEEPQHLINKCSSSAVFNNFDLVEKILKEVTDDVRNNMELRLVNKTFRNVCHANLRKTHRNLKIEYIYVHTEDPDTEMITKNQVYINYRRFPVLNVYKYLIFLKNIVKVKIQSVVTKNLWQLRPSLQAFLHESIRLSLIKTHGDSLKKLIGMDEICPGSCEDCVLVPKECKEYGPLRIDHLRKSFTTPRVFEKLIVPDYLLDDIANSCVESTQSKEDCLKAVSDFVPSNISCKTLILKMSETRKEWIDLEKNIVFQEKIIRWPIPFPHVDHVRGRTRREDHEPMPREVIEVMLKHWKVQSVILKFVHKDHREEHAGEWTRKNWFTKLRFKESRDGVNISDPSFKIREVLVDLTDSLKCNSHLYAVYLPLMRNPIISYTDLPSIIRRVFLNDKLKIQFSHHAGSTHYTTSQVVDFMMTNINAEAPQNLEVEIISYLKFKDDIEYLDELSKQEPQMRPSVLQDFLISNLPNAINVLHQTVNCQDPPSYPFVNKEWIGRCCQMVNQKRNCTIKWTFFMNEDSRNRNDPPY